MLFTYVKRNYKVGVTLFFKNREFDFLKNLKHQIRHDEVFVPFALDCSFELYFSKIQKYVLNFNDKNVALMWSYVYDDYDNFVNSLNNTFDDPHLINSDLLNTKSPIAKAANCYKLMYLTDQNNLFGSKKVNEISRESLNNLKLLKEKQIIFSFNKRKYNKTCIQDLKYLNLEEKQEILNYKSFFVLTENKDDLKIYDGHYANHFGNNKFLIWSKK
jgi:hypothetical protein